MAKEQIRKMTDAIYRSREIRAESKQRREQSHKLVEQAEKLLRGVQGSRTAPNGLRGTSKK